MANDAYNLADEAYDYADDAYSRADRAYKLADSIEMPGYLLFVFHCCLLLSNQGK